MRIALLALAVGCYSPSYRDCQLACASDTCPNGLSCLDGLCRTGESTLACGQMPDAGGMDGAGSDGACSAWTVANIADPCSLLMDGAWTINSGTYDTMTGSGANGPAGAMIPIGNETTRVVRVTSFTVPVGKVVMFAGPYPMIIVADTVQIDGTITVSAGANDFACPATLAGAAGQSCGGGGAGGSFGASGGNGGACTGVGNALASTAGNGNTIMEPLRGGCPGGMGAAPGDSAAGAGGPSGGALEISAKSMLVVSATGVILASGYGGAPGRGGTSATACNGTGCAGGAGGGGSGGGILIEAPALSVAGRLCANGGGGGGGGQNASGTSAGPGQVGQCGNLGATGGNGGGSGGNEGTGGYLSTPPGGVGGTGGMQDGGGGGGGGAGRIRVHTPNGSWEQNGALVTPAAYEG